MIDARKERFDENAAWTLLKGAKSISIAKGRKFQKFETVPGKKEEILKQAMGPSGNLRAPTYRRGDEFVIGFNPDLYAAWLK